MFDTARWIESYRVYVRERVGSNPCLFYMISNVLRIHMRTKFRFFITHFKVQALPCNQIHGKIMILCWASTDFFPLYA